MTDSAALPPKSKRVLRERLLGYGQKRSYQVPPTKAKKKEERGKKKETRVQPHPNAAENLKRKTNIQF